MTDAPPPNQRPAMTTSMAMRARKMLQNARMVLATRSSGHAAQKPGTQKDGQPSTSVVQRARNMMASVDEKLRALGKTNAPRKAAPAPAPRAAGNPGGVAAGVVQPDSVDFPLWTARTPRGYPGAEPGVPGSPDASAYAAQVDALLDARASFVARTPRKVLELCVQAYFPPPDARKLPGGISNPAYVASQGAHASERKVAMEMLVRRYASSIRAGRTPGDALVEGILAALSHMNAFREAYLGPLKAAGAVPSAQPWPAPADLRNHVMGALMDAGAVDISGHVAGRHGYGK